MPLNLGIVSYNFVLSLLYLLSIIVNFLPLRLCTWVNLIDSRDILVFLFHLFLLCYLSSVIGQFSETRLNKWGVFFNYDEDFTVFFPLKQSMSAKPIPAYLDHKFRQAKKATQIESHAIKSIIDQG